MVTKSIDIAKLTSKYIINPQLCGHEMYLIEENHSNSLSDANTSAGTCAKLC